jgi:intracellular multiplication protein IcmV
MGIISGTAKLVKPFVNFPKWMGVKYLGGSVKVSAQILRDLTTPKKATRQETFEQALLRLRISEQDLAVRAQQLFWLFLLFSALALAIFGYTCYLFSQSAYRGGCAGFVVMAIAATLAFKHHFWLFQIKQRRLGCSWREWLHQGLLRRAA